MILDRVHRVSEAVYRQRNARAIPQTNDLIFAREAPAGNIAVIQDGEKVCLGQRTVLVRPIVRCINPDYLAYYILSPISQQNLVDKSSGTTVAHVNLSDFRPYLVAVPPIKEQLRIIDRVAKLLPLVELYDIFYSKLENLNEEVYTRLRNSILQDAIKGKLVPQIESEGNAKELLEEIRTEKKRLVKEGKLKKAAIANESRIFRGDDNKYYEQIGSKVIDIDGEIPFDIPETWRWSRFGIVINLLSGRDLEPDRYNDSQSGIPYMTGASNFDGNTLMVNRWTQTPITVSKIGDLLITCKGTIGTMAINDVGDIHIARQIMAISSSVNIDFIRIFLSNSLQTLTKKAKSMIPGISRKDITEMLIPIPPLKEQERIVDRFYTLMNHIG